MSDTKRDAGPSTFDPDATIRELREWAEATSRTGGKSTLDNPGAANAMRMLDRWLSNGGTLPEAWQQCREVVQLGSKLNDAYYERDVIRDERDVLQGSLNNRQGGAR